MRCQTILEISSATITLALILLMPTFHQADAKSRAPVQQRSGSLAVKPSTDSLIRKADYWRERGEIEKAITLYDQAIKIDGNAASAYFGRALVWEEFGKMDRALADFSMAIKIEKPFYEKAVRLRGDLCQSLRRYDEAVKDYSMVINRHPTDGLYFSRANCYMRLNKPAQALADYNKALGIRGPRAPILEKRADAYFSLRQDAKALADYNTTLKLDPDGDQSKDGHEHLHKCKAEIYKRSGKTDLYKIELEAAAKGRSANIDMAPFSSRPLK